MASAEQEVWRGRQGTGNIEMACPGLGLSMGWAQVCGGEIIKHKAIAVKQTRIYRYCLEEEKLI